MILLSRISSLFSVIRWISQIAKEQRNWYTICNSLGFSGPRFWPPFQDIVQKLDVKALPYIIFLVVPILGRMSDSDDDIRSTATNTFASLVKTVPLEVCTILLTFFNWPHHHRCPPGWSPRSSRFHGGVTETPYVFLVEILNLHSLAVSFLAYAP
jgi:hypothetical protein